LAPLQTTSARGQGGLAIVVMRQLPRCFFLRICGFVKIFSGNLRLFLKWFDAFLKISILFENIFREIEAFF
jgi:hypothetical protein